MFYDDRVRIDKSNYKKPPKPKPFECTRCGKDCDHTTTSMEVFGIEIIPDDEAYCKRCTTYAKKKTIEFLERKLEEVKDEETNT